MNELEITNGGDNNEQSSRAAAAKSRVTWSAFHLVRQLEEMGLGEEGRELSQPTVPPTLKRLPKPIWSSIIISLYLQTLSAMSCTSAKLQRQTERESESLREREKQRESELKKWQKCCQLSSPLAYPPICYWANTVVFQLQFNRLKNKKKAKSQAKQSDSQMNL